MTTCMCLIAKISENKYFIEFELVSPLEVENYKLPARIMIANYCPWKYRGIGCRYGSRGDYSGPTTEFNRFRWCYQIADQLIFFHKKNQDSWSQ